MKARLILVDGTMWEGESFGAPVNSSGEVVFNTGMSGYPESLTDPSYFGQILVLTYPLVGNYGIPQEKFLESGRAQIKALIVQNYIDKPSHFESKQTLGSWLKKEGVPALFGVDTRQLTRKLRHSGVMLGRIEFKVQNSELNTYDPNKENVLPYVCIKHPKVYGEGKKHIVLIDCGAKDNILRSLLKRGVRVSIVPHDFDPIENKLDFDGVLVSNGPGDPKKALPTTKIIKKLLQQNFPIFGICLGSQLLALATGADTYKLRFGHRGQNQPVQNLISQRALITSQNHGFAIDPKTLKDGWKEWFINLNDNTNEGIRHKNKPFMSVQFHPESNPGPREAEYLFDEFIGLL